MQPSLGMQRALCCLNDRRTSRSVTDEAFCLKSATVCVETIRTSWSDRPPELSSRSSCSAVAIRLSIHRQVTAIWRRMQAFWQSTSVYLQNTSISLYRPSDYVMNSTRPCRQMTIAQHNWTTDATLKKFIRHIDSSSSQNSVWLLDYFLDISRTRV